MKETNDELLKIVLTIGGQKIEINVPRREEQIFRDAAKMVNQKYQDYLNEFPKQSKETYLTMTLVDIAVRLQREFELNCTLDKLVEKIDDGLARRTTNRDGDQQASK